MTYSQLKSLIDRETKKGSENIPNYEIELNDELAILKSQRLNHPME